MLYALEFGDEHDLPTKLPIPLDQFQVQNGILIRELNPPQKVVTQVVVPDTLRPQVLQPIHTIPTAGHPGTEKSLEQARKIYSWKTMKIDKINNVAQYLEWAKHKGTTHKPAPSQSYPIPE